GAVFTRYRLPAHRQLFDKLVYIGGLCRPTQLFGCYYSINVAVTHIFYDRRAEQLRRLANPGHVAPQVLQADTLNVIAVDQNPAQTGLQIQVNQSEQRALARPARADDADFLSGFN